MRWYGPWVFPRVVDNVRMQGTLRGLRAARQLRRLPWPARLAKQCPGVRSRCIVMRVCRGFRTPGMPAPTRARCTAPRAAPLSGRLDPEAPQQMPQGAGGSEQRGSATMTPQERELREKNRLIARERFLNGCVITS